MRKKKNNATPRESTPFPEKNWRKRKKDYGASLEGGTENPVRPKNQDSGGTCLANVQKEKRQQNDGSKRTSVPSKEEGGFTSKRGPLDAGNTYSTEEKGKNLRQGGGGGGGVGGGGVGGGGGGEDNALCPRHQKEHLGSGEEQKEMSDCHTQSRRRVRNFKGSCR